MQMLMEPSSQTKAPVAKTKAPLTKNRVFINLAIDKFIWHTLCFWKASLQFYRPFEAPWKDRSRGFVQTVGRKLNMDKVFSFGDSCVSGGLQTDIRHRNEFRLVGGSSAVRDLIH